MRIWLDDVRPAPEGWEWVKSAEEAKKYIFGHHIGSCEITHLSLDHDLGENVETGYDVVNYIEELVVTKQYKAPLMQIHSANPVGRLNMERAITRIAQYSLFENEG